MLCEGSSLRSISRVCDVSINTVSKLLEDAGEVCAAFHDEHVRDSLPNASNAMKFGHWHPIEHHFARCGAFKLA